MKTPPQPERAPDQATAEAVRPDHVASAPRPAPGYLRKSDWLRAQFLPELELLDFRGLFVGNKGLWILEDWKTSRRRLADPNQIADLLHRGNAHRASGDHVKALMRYQELVELDPQNTDFRFLLELTYQAIAAGGCSE